MNYHYMSSVTKMLEDLGWKDLAEGRRDLRLALLYKIVHGHIAVPTDGIQVTANTRTRLNHQYKYRYMSASSTEYNNCFFPRTIKDRNNCSVDLNESSSLDAFKTHLLNAAGTHAYSCWNPSA